MSGGVLWFSAICALVRGNNDIDFVVEVDCCDRFYTGVAYLRSSGLIIQPLHQCVQNNLYVICTKYDSYAWFNCIVSTQSLYLSCLTNRAILLHSIKWSRFAPHHSHSR